MNNGKYIVIKQLRKKLPLYIQHFLEDFVTEYQGTKWKCNGEMLFAVSAFIERYKLENDVDIRYKVGFPYIEIQTSTGKSALLNIHLY